MSEISPEQMAVLSGKLRGRRAELLALLRAARKDSGRDNLQQASGEVGDPGDESLALQLVDLNLAERENEVRELRAIERALERMRENTYGDCIDCGCAIPYARLEAYPTAERCTECQARHERVYGGRDVTPTL